MGKSFKRDYEDWDYSEEDRAQKFRKRRNDKLKKKSDHDEALRSSNNEISEEESETL